MLYSFFCCNFAEKYETMKHLNRFINTDYLMLFVLSVVNLLFLHHQFLQTIGLESDCFKTSYFDNLLACLLDVSVVLAVVWLITLRRLRLSLGITFIITLLWSFCNVFYARFFQQYLSWSSMGQAGNLADEIVIDSMMAGFSLIDLYYPLAAVLFGWLYFRSRHHDIVTKSLTTTLVVWGCTLMIGLAVHLTYLVHPTKTVVYVYGKTMFTPPLYNSLWPNWTVFHKGTIRRLVLDNIFYSSKIALTPDKREKIEKEYTNHQQRKTQKTLPDSIKNVIFIIVESYLASTSDLIVDGKEITPNLNRLKHANNVYYNGHMRPNIATGESSDGQFIYMTGLLPLHSEITVSKAKYNTLIGLPKQLKDAIPKMQSAILIPTNPTLWEQDIMSPSYGFDKLYSKIDYQKDMNDRDDSDMGDDKIFAYASEKGQLLSQPFYFMILTMSTHHPYTTYVKHDFQIKDKNLTEKYKNYLITCHYTDMMLGKYLQYLQKEGLYDTSMIIIVSDHDAHLKFLDMEGIISNELPVYIINGGIDKDKAWAGECNQLDVYTTILDIMGVESEWRGLGHTLLNTDYQNSVNDDIQELSDWIIYGDYFKLR